MVDVSRYSSLLYASLRPSGLTSLCATSLSHRLGYKVGMVLASTIAVVVVVVVVVVEVSLPLRRNLACESLASQQSVAGPDSGGGSAAREASVASTSCAKDRELHRDATPRSMTSIRYILYCL